MIWLLEWSGGPWCLVRLREREMVEEWYCQHCQPGLICFSNSWPLSGPGGLSQASQPPSQPSSPASALTFRFSRQTWGPEGSDEPGPASSVLSCCCCCRVQLILLTYVCRAVVLYGSAWSWSHFMKLPSPLWWLLAECWVFSVQHHHTSVRPVMKLILFLPVCQAVRLRRRGIILKRKELRYSEKSPSRLLTVLQCQCHCIGGSN